MAHSFPNLFFSPGGMSGLSSAAMSTLSKLGGFLLVIVVALQIFFLGTVSGQKQVYLKAYITEPNDSSDNGPAVKESNRWSGTPRSTNRWADAAAVADSVRLEMTVIEQQ